jgi:hypothetical protein
MNHRSYNEMRGSTAVQYCKLDIAGGSTGQYTRSTGCIAALALLRGSTSLPRLAFALVFGFVLMRQPSCSGRPPVPDGYE